MKTIFFSRKAGTYDIDTCLAMNLQYKVWRPDSITSTQYGLPFFPFIVWEMFHILHIFRNRNFFVFLVYDYRTLVHRSCVFPGYFRFPFMGMSDLQIGDIWTLEDYRGKGIAQFVLSKIISEIVPKDTTVWFLSCDNNEASIRVAQKVGLMRVGEGYRTKPLGFSLLGQYILDHRYDKTSPARRDGER